VTDLPAPATPVTPAAAGTELALVHPAPVIAVDPAAAALLEATADTFVESVVDLDVRGPALAGKVASITRMGDRELREAAAVSNRVLDLLVEATGSGLFDHGQDALRQQAVALWATIARLQQYTLLTAYLDRALEVRVPGLDASDPDRARVLRHMQRHARGRHDELLTAFAIATQGYLALDVVRGSDAELGKGVDHATTAPVAALRSMRATVMALRRVRGSPAVDGGGGELALPAALPPAGVLPASVSGGD
jgi:Toxic anion resistance protein (TelA)